MSEKQQYNWVEAAYMYPEGEPILVDETSFIQVSNETSSKYEFLAYSRGILSHSTLSKISSTALIDFLKLAKYEVEELKIQIIRFADKHGPLGEIEPLALYENGEWLVGEKFDTWKKTIKIIAMIETLYQDLKKAEYENDPLHLKHHFSWDKHGILKGFYWIGYGDKQLNRFDQEMTINPCDYFSAARMVISQIVASNLQDSCSMNFSFTVEDNGPDESVVTRWVFDLKKRNLRATLWHLMAARIAGKENYIICPDCGEFEFMQRRSKKLCRACSDRKRMLRFKEKHSHVK